MDFKELLSLAKDNQSFAQKKFQRDKLQKSKDPNKAVVSDSAVKAFMAKKKKVEEEKKAAEEAERRKRIQARLDTSLGKKIKTNTNTNQTRINDIKHEKSIGRSSTSSSDINRNTKPSKVSGSIGGIEKKTGEISKDRFQIPKKGVAKEEKPAKTERIDRKTSSTSKTAVSSEEPKKPSFKQHRRRKGADSNFEWSGSVTSDVAKDIDRNSTPRGRPFGSNTSSSLSFKDLMSVAKQQKDKPTTLKTAVKDRLKMSDNQQNEKTSPNDDIPKRDNVLSNSTGNNLKEKSKKELPNEIGSKPRILKPNHPKVMTQTLEIKSNYPQGNNHLASDIKNWKGIKAVPRGHIKVPTKGYRPDVAVKRQKVSSIDDELEREMRELERKRNILKRKMQGRSSQEDDYDEYDDYGDEYDDYDDLDDFIDDGGDEVDYSRHIRNIFGYDRKRFLDDDDDDLREMESNYRQIAAEEAKSSRIGKLEDEIERRKLELEEKAAKRKKK